VPQFPEIARAWDEVYWLFASQLIAEESRLYTLAGLTRHSRGNVMTSYRSLMKPKTLSPWFCVR
jgi:hypothetical protein